MYIIHLGFIGWHHLAGELFTSNDKQRVHPLQGRREKSTGNEPTSKEGEIHPQRDNEAQRREKSTPNEVFPTSDLLSLSCLLSLPLPLPPSISSSSSSQRSFCPPAMVLPIRQSNPTVSPPTCLRSLVCILIFSKVALGTWGPPKTFQP